MAVQYDLAVLGAGIAGSAAALAAAQRGARVCVISGPPAATALFSGAWRGPCPAALRAALNDAGYELHECDDVLPHPAGALVRADFTTASHREARLHADSLVVGITGLSGFDAPALAQLWSDQSGAALGAATIALEGTPRTGWAPVSLAAAIERDVSVIARPLHAEAQRRNARRVIVPALLGMRPTDELRQRLADQTGCTIGEALGAPPSLPGWRLHNALRRALAAAGVAVIESRASRSASDRRQLREIAVNGETVRARAFVLATGKFASGGIVGDGIFREAALGCPVWVEHLGELFDAPESLILTDPVRNENQPILRAGVHTNAAQQPVDRGDDVVYENVFVAGSVRSDWLPASHGIGESAQDGWRAGTRAVQT